MTLNFDPKQLKASRQCLPAASSLFSQHGADFPPNVLVSARLVFSRFPGGFTLP
jgi:hypothetical protein